MVRSRASSLVISRCRVSVSQICSPMVRIGFSVEMGSWKTKPIWPPRTSRSSSVDSVQQVTGAVRRW